MAKKTAAEASASAESHMKNNSGEPPPEWRKLDSRVAGFWDETQEPLCGTVVGARTFVNSQDRETTVVMVKLLKPCHAQVKLEGGGVDVTELQTGELCGVFVSAGLTALLDKGNARVWVKRAGTRKTKRGTMKVYDIRSPDDGTRVKVEQWSPNPRGQEPADNASDIDEAPF